MTQQTSPFLEGKFGWALGESNWNLGMDENLVKFSYMFDKNIDSITATLPAYSTGTAHFNTTDNRLYFDVGGQRYSSPTPKWFVVTLRTTGQYYQFNGTSLLLIPSNTDLSTTVANLESNLNNSTDVAKGANKIGFLGRKVFDRLREEISIIDFKVVGQLDWDAAFLAARNYIAAQTTPTLLVFPAGIYEYTVSPNWAIQDSMIEARGEVRLRYSGVGNAVILDAGPTAPDLVYNMKFGAGNKFIIECPSTALNAVYVRGVHHSKIGASVRGAGTASAGVLVEFAVCTEIDVAVSVNEEGWYLGSKPAVGVMLDKRLVNEQTSYCYFPNPIIEGPDVGIHLVNTLGNIFIGGTSEACSQYGVFAPIGASGDRFFGTDFEANGVGDVYALGSGIEVISCDSDNEIIFGTTATLCQVRGGRHKTVLIDVGAAGCSATDLIFNRSNTGGVVTDLGTNSIVRGCRNGGNNALYLTGSKTYDPPSIASGAIAQTTVTVSGAKLTDKATASFSLDIGGLVMVAAVTATDTVTVTLLNLSGSPVDLSSGTLSCAVQRGN